MRMLFLAALSAALLAGLPPQAAAQTRFFFAGGPTGTLEHGFPGGWGGTLGLERPIAPAAAFLVRVEGHAVPTGGDRYYVAPVGLGSLGERGPYSKDATLVSVMAGLRLSSRGPVVTYLDALVGAGYFNNPFNTSPGWPFSGRGTSESQTNVAVSVGPGISIRTGQVVSLFADIHLDRYFAEGADTPIVPLRVGFIVP